MFVTEKLYSDTKEGLVSIPVSAPERILQLPCQVREHILLTPDSSLSHPNTHTFFKYFSILYNQSLCNSHSFVPGESEGYKLGYF